MLDALDRESGNIERTPARSVESIIGALRGMVNPDSVSKVTDPDTGEPMVVYQGTGDDISEFRVSERGEFGGGVYLTPDTAGASDYAIYRGRGPANVMPGYATIKNPATAREASQIASWRGEENAQAEMIRRGYDGVIDMRSGQVVAFRPEQIKSTTGNNGDFDGANPNITAQRLLNIADFMQSSRTVEPPSTTVTVRRMNPAGSMQELNPTRTVRTITLPGEISMDDVCLLHHKQSGAPNKSASYPGAVRTGGIRILSSTN